METRFLEAAELELRDAFDYYEEQRVGLGEEFAQEVYAAIGRIVCHPHAWAKLSKAHKKVSNEAFSLWNCLRDQGKPDSDSGRHALEPQARLLEGQIETAINPCIRI